ncbi:hypothetical protein B296_00002961 [Ensete ventricosum]|uniref:Uncharacterized protein n=1 Tax=Ensete ventricosum TaxID=4639 RepID=A0A427AHU6_ENSVE|nr:hypothetical protein B296_00002961 [Ensete ventricosum]
MEVYKISQAAERKDLYRAAPPIPGIDVGSPAQQQLHDTDMSLTRRYMQRRPAVQIDAVHVDAIVHELLHPLSVPLARQEQQLHGGVEVIRHRELLPGGALGPTVRIERGLPPEAKPTDIAKPRVEGEVALEAKPPAPPHRTPRELPRNAALELLRRLHLCRSPRPRKQSLRLPPITKNKHESKSGGGEDHILHGGLGRRSELHPGFDREPGRRLVSGGMGGSRGRNWREVEKKEGKGGNGGGFAGVEEAANPSFPEKRTARPPFYRREGRSGG